MGNKKIMKWMEKLIFNGFFEFENSLRHFLRKSCLQIFKFNFL